MERSFDSAMQAWILRPEDFLVNNNIATILLMQHRFKEAEPFIKKMEEAWMPNKDLEDKKWRKLKALRAQMDRDMKGLAQFMSQDKDTIIKQMRGG